MSTFTFTDQVIELEDIDTGSDGRVYGDSSITDRHPTKGFALGKRVVTTNWVVCHDLYNALHDDNGCQLEDVGIRITFDLSIEHEPRTRDYPGFDGREVTVTKVEVITSDGRVLKVFSIDFSESDYSVAGVVEALYQSTLEDHEPEEPEQDHPRI